ncbi:helix-turn-helix domain-containing protein [Paractinoplanes brasiliensis]|uniref:Excisionase family DNA binding protein n=1 Tax=Paractinoplanes brasiliensis TaxID=52695 RepID=A0A4V3C7Q1_9ACTN|nr:helix-turn-helix domain-containing protein [Actinoplanes brasiliensis]TDO38408.1 excisionase family DNA binding protein [Actinoplanes brasiliensis]GID26816.1 hypothetical protein Abr02nite_17990 [Actinoplanes brasiliensis]
MTTPPQDFPESTPQIFTIPEAAQILRVKPSWLEKKAAARRIPFTMLGGAYRFSPEHLQQIILAFEHRPQPTAERESRPLSVARRHRRALPEIPDPGVIPLRPRVPRGRPHSTRAA